MIPRLPVLLRGLLRQPGFCLVAVATLTLGIGGTLAVFSLADALLLRPLPYPDAERLMVLSTAPAEAVGVPDGPGDLVSYLNFRDWRRTSRSFEAMQAFSQITYGLTLTGGDEPERAEVRFVSDGFFELLGAGTVHGRLFGPEDAARGSAPVAILGHDLWRSRFAGDPGVIGEVISLGDQPFTVVGVLESGFREFTPEQRTSIWVPLPVMGTLFNPAFLDDRSSRWLTCLARLAPEVTLERARHEMSAVMRRLAADFPEVNRGVGPTVAPLARYALGYRDFTAEALVLGLGAGLVLVIGCVNVANLLLARTAGRRRENAIRLAIGAQRRNLVAAQLAETVVLSLVAAVFGSVLAFWAIRVVTAIEPLPLPPFVQPTLDVRALGFAVLLALVTGLAIGLASVVRSGRPELRRLLDGGRGAAGSAALRGRNLLIAGEVAIAMVLLLSAGLMLRSLLSYRDVDYGFDTEGLLTVQLDFSKVRYYEGDLARARTLYRDLVAAVDGVPGVRSVHLWALGRVGWSYWPRNIIREDRPGSAIYERCQVFESRITPGAIPALGLGLAEGRYLELADDENGPHVAVVSASAARRCWPGESPLGKRFRRFDREDAPWLTVVGVVADSRQRGRRHDTFEDVYFPLAQAPTIYLSLMIYGDRDPSALVPAIRRAVRELDPEVPLYDIATMAEWRREEEEESRFYAALTGGYAAIALSLVCLGVYGVVSYGIRLRTREIAIRMALGGERRQILSLVAGGTMTLVAAGLAVGMGLGVLLGRFMRSVLFETAATDPLTFGTAPLVLVAVAGAACWLASRHALRIPPSLALKQQ